YVLRLHVRGHVERAVQREVVHGHDMGESVLVDGGQGGYLAFPEELGLLVGAQLDLVPSVGRHCPLTPIEGRAGASRGSAWPRRSSASPHPRHSRGGCARRSRGGRPRRTWTCSPCRAPAPAPPSYACP